MNSHYLAHIKSEQIIQIKSKGERAFSTTMLKTLRGNGLFTKTLRSRFYHSIDHPSSNNILDAKSLESRIFERALLYVPKYGFDELCIGQAVKDLNYPESLESYLSIAGNGKSYEFQLMLGWLKAKREELRLEVLNPHSEFHNVSNEYERVSFLIKKRLEYNRPIINKLGAGISQLLLPYNMNESMEELQNLSDDIAFYSGDISNDFAWYSKRFSFGTVYISSELYMLQDTSKNFKNTDTFVDEKISAVRSLGKAYNDTEEWGLFNAISLINLIKSQALRG